ncbi:MAG: helix-turn-helix domain-containing protein [Saprospiraceae bacterium]|nr:helix-turn-helix domain-containing protein [Saprospiraceae bacterium]
MMIKSKVRTIREELGYTQAELAEHTNLSIRTIQRVESGQSIPKGHTLQVLAQVLGVDKSELRQQEPGASPADSEENLKLKLINLATLCFLGIPFGNLVVPFILWEKYRIYPMVDKVGRKILNFQILWTICTVLMLIFSPFLQDYITAPFSLMLVLGLLAVAINLFFIFKTAKALTRQDYNILPLKVQFL